MSEGPTTEKRLALYATMFRIRKIQLKIEELYPQDQMKTPVHLCLGEEAIATGVCAQLTREDYVWSNHRGHGHYLAKGGNLPALFAELYCKETGCSRGRGGSMHLIDTAVNLMGTSSIVSGSIPLAVGAALSATLRGEPRISVSFFGDAASEEGVLYESMGLAMLKRLPVIFVCENNFYSVFSHQSARQSDPEIFRRAGAYSLPARRVDGSRVEEVFAAAGEAVARARSGGGPSFIEARVCRWRQHAGPGDPQAALYRRMQEHQEWLGKDPVSEYETQLSRDGVLTEAVRRELSEKMDREIAEAVAFGQSSPLPDGKDLSRYLLG